MNQTDKAIEEITRALSSAGGVANADITSQNSGVNGIDLLAAANVVTLKTPFTDIVPREPAGATGLGFLHNVIKGGVSGDSTGYTEEGKRGGQGTFAGVQSGASYKVISHEIPVTDEARYGSEGQIDLLAAAVTRALIEAKRIQERRFLYGRSSKASDAFAVGRLTTTPDGSSVAATPTPTVVPASTGGFIGAATYSVIAVALAGEAASKTRGYRINSASLPATAGSELLPVTRTNGDGSTTVINGGAAIKSSAASSGAVTGSTNKLTCSVAPVAGAVGYAWFVGASGSEVYQGTTFTAQAVFTSLVSGTQAAAANFTADNSAESWAYDGILTRIFKGGSGAYITTMANGATLTADGQGGILQLSDIFANMYAALDGYSPKYVMCNGSTQQKINALILGTANPTTFLTKALDDTTEITAGKKVGSLFNPIAGAVVKIIDNPSMLDGTILIGTDTIPTVVPSPATTPVFFRPRRDYWAEVWPRTTRKIVNSVTIDGALGFRWLDGFGVVTNFS